MNSLPEQAASIVAGVGNSSLPDRAGCLTVTAENIFPAGCGSLAKPLPAFCAKIIFKPGCR